MAFNKSKALESALKYLNQGKVNQAIAEYQQILRNDPKDQATLMTVGDLFARQGDMSHALEYFERLAQVYLADGFNSKAIAIYKKIAKLAPSEITPLEKLADLYVQQGVLSEARPLFLQIAEAHLKANRAPKAVEVLHRLLEVEPENPRVQMRLAELYNVMGNKGDAAKTYLGYGQRLFDRGENAEADKLVERALEVAPGDASALLLKARILASIGKDAAAIKILAKHPEADAGTEVTNLLIDLELKTGQIEAAADRARNQLVRGNSHFGLLFRVSESLVEKDHAEEALPLFRELRDPMIEVGEHDKFVKSLSAAAERLPGNTEALELLADFCRHTSDPFPLNGALTKLIDLYEAAGNTERMELLLEEYVDRNRDDERMAARLESLRIRLGKSPKAEVHAEAQAASESTAPAPTEEELASPGVPIQEEALDPETLHYISQALTDVDLFSSYGLTQKATNLLEAVLQRAPRHTPTLERLLDLSVGAGNDRRTAELAATLERIHRQRGDDANADKFGEIYKRFESALTTGGPPKPADQEPMASPSEVQEIEPASVGAVPVDIDIESTVPAVQQFEIPSSDVGAEEIALVAASAEEVDLSDEWEAMVQEVAEPPQPAVVQASSLPPAAPLIEPVAPPETVNEESGFELDAAPEALPLEPEVYEIQDETAQEPSAESEELFEFCDVLAPATSSVGAEPSTDGVEFELELTPELAEAEQKGATTTEEFINELAAEVDEMEPLAAEDAPFQPSHNGEIASSPLAHEVQHDAQSAPPEVVPEATEESLNQLSEVFQEFRSELGELGEENEDLETHYNLGIAYREMGLLEEAIGEFQKVAKAVQKGKPFRYAMNCATLLALTFQDKGEPKIAALWYQRALEVPGLDQEAILALRYDLGISLELAGESDAALDCFRQVYVMNIDYRDVADRIATLQHH